MTEPQKSEASTTLREKIAYLVYNATDHYQNDHPDADQTQECMFAIETIDELEALIRQREAEAYKKGYIAGGIDEITRHEKARQQVEKEIGE